MGKLLEALNKRFSQRPDAGIGDGVGEDWRSPSWRNAHMLLEEALAPRHGEALAADCTYDDSWGTDISAGIREMFRDVYLAVLDTISFPKSEQTKLIVEPHVNGYTQVVIIRGESVLYYQKHEARFFDFDSSHDLEVFMSSVRERVITKLKELGLFPKEERS